MLNKIFPKEPNYWRGSRELIVFLRAIHTFFVVVFMGSSFFSPQNPYIKHYLIGVTLSGFFIVLLELTRFRYWIFQITGLTVIVKIILLLLIELFPSLRNPILVVILFLSVIISHLSRKYRHSFWYKK